ncbi:MAG: homoserine kinase [Xanthomonadales bacterium]|nr:homoserine kinase [Xanthomonadales bacterium]
MFARHSASAFAPASVGNVGVGFDILGHALSGAGDRVSVRTIDQPEVRIDAVRGSDHALPLAAELNTAGAALIALRTRLGSSLGFAVEIDKGIPFGSGMGGSAASAVAAVVAANGLLDAPLDLSALYDCALSGEAVASGSRHGDNVAPMLLGGLTLATEAHPPVRIAVPTRLYCAHVHPHCVVETRAARAALAGSYALGEFVAQSGHLALLMHGLHAGDPEMIAAGLSDVLIEPRRAGLIPGFAAVKQAALAAGALGAAISGAGPSVFAWCWGDDIAQRAAQSMRAAFAAHGLDSDVLVGPVDAPGARLLDGSA